MASQPPPVPAAGQVEQRPGRHLLVERLPPQSRAQFVSNCDRQSARTGRGTPPPPCPCQESRLIHPGRQAHNRCHHCWCSWWLEWPPAVPPTMAAAAAVASAPAVASIAEAVSASAVQAVLHYCLTDVSHCTLYQGFSQGSSLSWSQLLRP